MKKLIIGLTVLMACLTVLSGCGKDKNSSYLKLKGSDKNVITGTAKNAKRNVTATSSIKVEKGEKLVVTTKLNGTVRIEIKRSDKDSSKNAVEDRLTGKQTYKYSVKKGTYDVKVITLSKVNGSIKIETRSK